MEKGRRWEVKSQDYRFFLNFSISQPLTFWFGTGAIPLMAGQAANPAKRVLQQNPLH
jgi:hypothetical protein